MRLKFYSIFLQKPITNFTFPFVSMVNWFPEADVLKKREMLRQLVQNLQSQLNPDLQYDLQQGSMSATPVMSETSIDGASVSEMSVDTAGDAAVLNPVSAASDADLLQSSSEHNLSDKPEDSTAGPVPSVAHCLPEDDVADTVKCPPSQILDTAAADGVKVMPVVTDAAASESLTLQTVTAGITATNDVASDSSLPATAAVPVCRDLNTENTETSDGVAEWSSRSSPISAQDVSDCSIVSSLTVFEHFINERSDDRLVADAGHVILSDVVTDVRDRLHIADVSGSSSSNPCQVKDMASCIDDSVSQCTVAAVSEMSVDAREIRNSTGDLSAAETANS